MNSSTYENYPDKQENKKEILGKMSQAQKDKNSIIFLIYRL